MVSVPGVTSAGIRGCPQRGRLPESNGGYWLGEGRIERAGVRLLQAAFTVITPDYFNTMQIHCARTHRCAIN
jgi:hypothetical protein